MNYLVEFRTVVVNINGVFSHTRLEYRRKNIIVGALGLELGTWGAWETLNTVTVNENQ